MLENFFQWGPLPANQMIGTYNPYLVGLSYLVAVFASYIALDITGRLREPGNPPIINLLWTVGGAIAMGCGIWSMHFIAMLSFKIKDMPLNYELFWTGLSLFVAIFISAFALTLLRSRVLKTWHLVIGGIILGIGIASMHYTGMEGMRSETDIHYLPGLFLLSILIAIFASEAALWFALKSNQVVSSLRIRLKVVSAIIMGIAICGMHYTGMAAAIFTPAIKPVQGLISLDPTLLSLCIAAVTLFIIGIAFFASTYKEALNQHQLEKARQLGMAEVSASVLHNVGNVLNSLNVSANLIADKIQNTKLKSLDDFRNLIHTHKDNLSTFIAEDPRGADIPNYLDMLTQLREVEEKYIVSEINTLTKNIQLIQNIISTQQTLSKIESLEQIVSVSGLVEEVLLLTDFNFARHNIMVNKNYARLGSILIDKVKFLQILVNLIQNARDALIFSPKKEKLLTISTGFINKNKFFVQVEDNGVGINPQNMNKLFIYGFTTKPSGHGFGLHTCILTARSLSGDIKVENKGLGKGAIFRVEMPYVVPNR